MRHILLALLLFPATTLACANLLSTQLYAGIQFDPERPGKVLILRDRMYDRDLVEWLDTAFTYLPDKNLEVVRYLTRYVNDSFYSAGKYDGPLWNLVDRGRHHLSQQAYNNLLHEPATNLLIGDLIRTTMANPEQRVAILFAALDALDLQPVIHYGLINIANFHEKILLNRSHTWITVRIDNKEYVADPTYRIVAPVDEVNVLGSQDSSLHISGVRYYKANLTYKGDPSRIRYEEVGKREIKRYTDIDLRTLTL